MKKIFLIILQVIMMQINVIFLTLIVSFTALIFLNGAARINNSGTEFRLVALHLANEQFAEIESRASEGNLSAGSLNFLGAADDLKNFGIYNDKDLSTKTLVTFSVTSTAEKYIGNLFKVEVKVSWNFAGKDFEIKLEKIVRAKKSE